VTARIYHSEDEMSHEPERLTFCKSNVTLCGLLVDERYRTEKAAKNQMASGDAIKPLGLMAQVWYTIQPERLY